MIEATSPTANTIRKASTIAPKTCQPWPRTSSRLLPKASNTPLSSTTMDGAMTDQIVSRIRPGTMIRTNPIAIAMPARMPFRMSVPTYGAACEKSSPTVKSLRPSRTSWTSFTT